MCLQVFAQVDNLKEVFPLSVGNSWTYSFSIGSVSGMSHSSVKDSGIVKLEIIGMIDSPDSIRWLFYQKREYYHDVYGIPTSGWYKDSSGFELIELKKGMHELYLSPYDRNGVFPYYKTAVDSEIIYRYVDIGSSNCNYKTRGKKTGSENDYYEFTMKTDTGMVKSTRRWYNASSTWNWARYYLSEFNKYYNEPFLSIPQKNYYIKTLTGIAKDTSIIIRNNGAQQLLLSDVVSSDERYKVLNYHGTIPPRSTGKINVRFIPLTSGNSSAVITISSNSLPSPNTITLNGNAYDSAILQLQPNNYIHFEGTANSEISKAIYSIYNLGNIELKIDSIKITNPAFTNTISSSIIKPGEITIDTVYFSPLYTSEYTAILQLYSNSRLEPYTIWLYGSSADQLNVEINEQSIYFRKTYAGEIKDTTIVITNHGKESIFLILRIINDTPHHIEYPFHFPNYYYSLEIEPNSSHYEIIRFQPQNSDYISCSVAHEFRSLNSVLKKVHLIKLEGNYPDYLIQNYPNPFNSTTKIGFQISFRSVIRLSVFDILGREVAVLVNEEKLPGSYEVEFDRGNLSSGVYFYRLYSNFFTQTKKFLLLK